VEDELVPDVVEAIGPIQLLSIAFEGNRFRGEILPELERLKREGILRILDLIFVRKDSTGAVMVTTATDLTWDEAVELGAYLGGLAGFVGAGPEGIERGAMAGAAQLADGHYFDEDDIFRVTQALPENMSAGIALLEHLWAKPLFDAIDNANGIELGNDWLQPDQVFTPSKLAMPAEPGAD
jgi:uncharacterized membrane protein